MCVCVCVHCLTMISQLYNFDGFVVHKLIRTFNESECRGPFEYMIPNLNERGRTFRELSLLGAMELS